MAILPPRPLRGSGKAAQTAFKPARRDGNSFIHRVNHFSNSLGIPKISRCPLLLELLRRHRWASQGGGWGREGDVHHHPVVAMEPARHHPLKLALSCWFRQSGDVTLDPT